MELGKQIYRLRTQKGITQEMLASEMGVSLSAVSKWENGVSMPDIMMLCALADYFQVTADEMLGRQQKKEGFMVCDDAPFMRQVMNDLLQKEGYRCNGLVSNGEELFAAMREKMPEVLFLDIHLENEDGLELLPKIKEEFGGVRVIIISADGAEETKERAARYGADAFITKPFRPVHVHEALERVKMI